MFKTLKDAAKLAKDLASAAGLAVAIGLPRLTAR